jgi:hypothetical protein
VLPSPASLPAATADPPRGEPPADPALAAEDSLPLPPPDPGAPPPRPAQRAGRAAERIDVACAQAQFRFQQGERVSAEEAAFIRSGCATRR